jgi:hypothetical protein
MSGIAAYPQTQSWEKGDYCYLQPWLLVILDNQARAEIAARQRIAKRRF